MPIEYLLFLRVFKLFRTLFQDSLQSQFVIVDPFREI